MIVVHQNTDQPDEMLNDRLHSLTGTVETVWRLMLGHRTRAFVPALLSIGTLVLAAALLSRTIGKEPKVSESGFIAVFAMGVLLLVLGAMPVLYREWATVEMARRTIEVIRLLLKERPPTERQLTEERLNTPKQVEGVDEKKDDKREPSDAAKPGSPTSETPGSD